MYPLFETICIKDGVVQNVEWHQRRYESSCFEFYGKKPNSGLLESFEVPNEFSKGLCKLRVRYNDSSTKLEFEKYLPKKRNSLKLVEANEIDYSLKYSDRSLLNELFEKRGTCDDVLIVKKGMITDTSYTNIVFYDGTKWFTPSTPLLNGTCRARLLVENEIETAHITTKDLNDFFGFNLINAMNDLDRNNFNKIENIFQ